MPTRHEVHSPAGSARVFAAALALALAAVGCAERMVYEGPGAFELTASPEAGDIRDGSSVQIIVTAQRGEGSTGVIELTAGALPSGFSVEPGAIAAGYETGVVTLHAAGALPGTAYRISIVGRGDGATAEREVQLFVTGKPGTVDVVFQRIGERPIIDEPPPHRLLRFSPRGGLLLAVDLSLYRYGADGLPDLSFGTQGVAYYGREPYGEGLHAIPEPQVVGELADGKLIVAVAYAAESSGPPAGVLLFRLTADGALDRTYGPNGNAASVAIPLPGFRPTSMAVKQDDELWLHVEGDGRTEMKKISRFGVVLGDSGVLPEAGQLGAEQREMVAQPDDKLVAAGPAQLVRFTPGLQLDESFGQGGVLPTGTVAPYVAAIAGGYVAAGATEAGPALWCFDEQWRAVPGFEGGLVIPGMSGRAMSAHAVDGGFNVAISSDRAQVVRVRRDGTLDPTFGDNGVLDLGPLDFAQQQEPNFPTLHGRSYSVTINGPLYQVTRYWD